MAYKDSHMNEMPYLSEQGLQMEQELKALSDQYHYRKLPKEVSKAQRAHYVEELDPFWRDGLYRDKEITLTAHDGTVLATGVTDRGFVCGDYGIFLEIDAEQMCMEHVKVAPGQEYRIHDPKYAGNVKYQWYTDTVGDGMKLYGRAEKRRDQYVRGRKSVWKTLQGGVYESSRRSDYCSNGYEHANGRSISR